jgi:hypothetical protein
MAVEATRFYSELIPFSAPNNELALRCFLKLVWEFYGETFRRSTLWVPRGWIEIENLVLSMQYRDDVPANESRETTVAKVLTTMIFEVFNLALEPPSLNWVYNYVLSSVLMTNENLVYTDVLKQIDWATAKLVKFAVAL